MLTSFSFGLAVVSFVISVEMDGTNGRAMGFKINGFETASPPIFPIGLDDCTISNFCPSVFWFLPSSRSLHSDSLPFLEFVLLFALFIASVSALALNKLQASASTLTGAEAGFCFTRCEGRRGFGLSGWALKLVGIGVAVCFGCYVITSCHIDHW